MPNLIQSDMPWSCRLLITARLEPGIISSALLMATKNIVYQQKLIVNKFIGRKTWRIVVDVIAAVLMGRGRMLFKHFDTVGNTDTERKEKKNQLFPTDRICNPSDLSTLCSNTVLVASGNTFQRLNELLGSNTNGLKLVCRLYF